MPLFTKASGKTWESTRPTECKGSGVASACQNWEKKGLEASKLKTAKHFQDARAVAQEMLTAIKTARGKLGGVKTDKDAKKKKQVDETTKLLAAWEKSVNTYKGGVDDAEAALAQAELKGAIDKAVESALASVTQIVEDNFSNLASNLSDMNAARRDPNAKTINTAIKASGKATFTIKNCTKTLSKDGFYNQVKTAFATAKITADEKTVPAPAQIKTWKQQLAAYESAIEDARGEIDRLTEELESEESGSSDPTYVAAFKKLVKEYDDTLKLLRAKEADAKKLLAGASGLLSAATSVEKDDARAINKVTLEAASFAARTIQLETAMKEVAASWRDTTNGAIAKMRHKVKPSEEDTSKILAPYVDRLNDGNLRGTRVLQQIRESLLKALKALDKTTGGTQGKTAARDVGLLAA